MMPRGCPVYRPQPWDKYWQPRAWYRLIRLEAALAALIAALLAWPAGTGYAAAMVPAGGRCAASLCVTMPDTARRATGLLVTDSATRALPAACRDVPIRVNDPLGNPMLWQDGCGRQAGLHEGGDGRPGDGGWITISCRYYGNAVAISPAGTLTLRACGPRGLGPAVTLTRRDINFLHRLERAAR